MSNLTAERPGRRNHSAVAGAGAAVGFLGGLIGLGGAEFRLPLLIGLFRYAALEAVILNKAMSLVVVAAALPLRMTSVSLASVLQRWDVIVMLLAGSLFGAWFGAGWAMVLRTQTLYRVISLLLAAIAVVLVFGHDVRATGVPYFNGTALAVAGALAGVVIGVVAAVLGVAGGELLIPTIVLLFGVDVKLAGSLSLAVSLPTMLVGFFRYRRDPSFNVIRGEARFIVTMAIGSLVGVFIGAQLLGVVSTAVLLPLLAFILLISALKVWCHA
ncbi:sulfite exporter TauE/SafE family protein [Variovorax sp. GT1P44]|uniref:sulfite exporter TauE/SafE family protein n=1 Tax=Variovorax sp. GT1P44 TaxID=3443742 RepID=UPI003F4720BC